MTGTDTGVGKTFVTAALARGLARSGLRVAAIKPVESGCRSGEDLELHAEDADAIAAAAGGWQRPEQRCLYRLSAPLAPGVAAEREGRVLVMEDMVAFVEGVSHGADVALVEGAGGWLVPLTGSLMIADLAAALALPVVVVARATLGTINHSLLTVNAVRGQGLSVAGVVLSVRPDDDLPSARSNQEQIERHAGCAVWLLSDEGWFPALGSPPFHVER